jgi:tyrosinase
MPRTRKDLWGLGRGWSDTLLWYAKAVAELEKRPVTDRMSWRYLAAIHGFDKEVWHSFGYIGANDQLPPQAERNRLWQQCQHQTWYFLPWHRGYLAAIEAIVRDAVVKLGGPADWALPYWNYSDTSNPKARELHPAFTEPTLPNGARNALLVKRRYGNGSGKVVIPPEAVALTALTEPAFTGTASGGSPGFGGVETAFSHGGNINGRLERRPHNGLHVLVGGSIQGADPNDPRNLGLMTNPDTAALDPIFWIHHANIDRLWEVWVARNPAKHKNPSDLAWLNGPANRKFVMPDAEGQTQVFTPAQMRSTTAPPLDYVYQDVSDPLDGTDRAVVRREALGREAAALGAAVEGTGMEEKPAELIGANDSPVQVGRNVETQVRMDRAATRRLSRSFATGAAAAPSAQEPDRVFLNLENIRGTNDAAVFYVYVNLPDDADPKEHPENLAGVVSLFGVTKASRSDSAHAGNGITEVLDITHVVDALHLTNALDLDHLKVRFVPHTDIGPRDNITVGRISVYRQSQ